MFRAQLCTRPPFCPATVEEDDLRWRFLPGKALTIRINFGCVPGAIAVTCSFDGAHANDGGGGGPDGKTEANTKTLS